MEDVQNRPADVLIPIDRVGINKFSLPVMIKNREGGYQHTVATAELGVDLPKDFKGTHMSRLVESLESWNEHLDYHTIKKFLSGVLERLEAKKAQAVFTFKYFLNKEAPVTKSAALQAYDCTFIGELEEDDLSFCMVITVPVMTVCPCSKAISDEGAHSQRADIRMHLALNSFCWLEDFIEIAEGCGSSPIYPVLKREDEKFVTEYAFAHPSFVEDVVRNLASKLREHDAISSFRVEVESYESIHAHNAFALIKHESA